MKSFFTVSFLFVVFFSVLTTAMSQITITNTDIQNGVLNSRRTHFENGDTLTVNLGVASGSAQQWDFQNLPWGNVMHRDTSYENIVSPAGQLRAEEFPTASGASVVSQSQIEVFGSDTFTITMTLAYYYELSPSAIKALGGAMRQQISPPPPPPFVADTTFVIHNVQKIMPLPLAVGLSETWTDTSRSPDGSYTVETHTINVNGFGTLTFPDGRSLSVLRMQEDGIELEYDNNGQFVNRERWRHISFTAQDFTVLSFDVDTTFPGGTTLADGWNWEVKTGTVGVEQTSNRVPDVFVLSQNYPNPFNPSTTIRFTIPDSRFTSLTVYNVLGQEVATLVNEVKAPGSYEVTFNTEGLPSGMYFYRLSSGGFSETKRMVLLR